MKVRSENKVIKMYVNIDRVTTNSFSEKNPDYLTI